MKLPKAPKGYQWVLILHDGDHLYDMYGLQNKDNKEIVYDCYISHTNRFGHLIRKEAKSIIKNIKMIQKQFEKGIINEAT